MHFSDYFLLDDQSPGGSEDGSTRDAEKFPFYFWAQVVRWECFIGAITESLVNSEQASDSDLELNMCLSDLLWLPRQHVLLSLQKKGGKNSFKHSEPQKAILIIKCISKYLISSSFSYPTLKISTSLLSLNKLKE